MQNVWRLKLMDFTFKMYQADCKIAVFKTTVMHKHSVLAESTNPYTLIGSIHKGAYLIHDSQYTQKPIVQLAYCLFITQDDDFLCGSMTGSG